MKTTLKQIIREEFYRLINEGSDSLEDNDKETSIESDFIGKQKGFNIWKPSSKENGKKIVEKYLQSGNKPPLYYRDVIYIPKYLELGNDIYFFIKDNPEKRNDWIGCIAKDGIVQKVFNGDDMLFPTSQRIYKYAQSIVEKS